jgi:hypothetical protein
MTITQINATDWLIKQDNWQLVLSTATQFHPNSEGGVTAEPDVLRQAREAMKNDFVASIARATEYFGMVQTNPSTAFKDYCSLYHPTLNVQSGINQVQSATASLPPDVSIQKLAAHILLPHPTFVDIATAKSQAEAYADGLFNTLLGAPTPAVAFDTLKEIADYIAQDETNYATLLTALGNRLRIDINNQGLSGAEQDNVKRNIGIENVNNTSDVNKPISSAVSAALLGKAESSHTHLQSDVTGLVLALAALQPLLVSGTNIKTVNGNSLLGTGDVAIIGGGDNYIELAVAFSSVVVSRVLVTGWAITMTTGKNYLIEIIADYQTAATTTGGSLGFVMTTGSATVKGSVEGDISQALAGNGLKVPIYAISSSNTLAGSFFTSTGVTVINSPHGITSRIYVRCTVGGVFNVQWATEVAASAAQLNTGSVMRWRQTN